MSNITDEVIENTFNRVVQSHKDFVINKGVAVNVIAMEDKRGGGGKKHVSAPVNVMENMNDDSIIMCPPMDSGDEMLEMCAYYATTRNDVPTKRTFCVCQREWNATFQLGKTSWISLRRTFSRKGSRSARLHWIIKTPCFSRATTGRE